MEIFKQIFTWWNSQTLGTRIYTWRKGNYVGSDNMGNKYYESKDRRRRWVIYQQETEASLVSAEWHGWLHQTFNEIPKIHQISRNSWEKPHKGNRTGSDNAYHPLKGEGGDRSRGLFNDYEPWHPEK